MTVTTEFYRPVQLPNNGVDVVYDFELEIIGADAFELWYVLNDGSKILAPPQDYNVQFFGQAPIFDAGSFTLNRTKTPLGTSELWVERNTPITQLVDFSTYSPFPMKMLEFALDKATMIAQELESRKCLAETTTEMTQLISFDPYTPLYASEVTFALDKLIAILNEINNTAESCRDRPEDT